MRSSWADRRGRCLAVAAAVALGVAAGAPGPDVAPTSALFTDVATASLQVGVAPCSGAHTALLAGHAPLLHLRFATTGTPAGNRPAPGLLRCDATGALALAGTVGEGHTSAAVGLGSATYTLTLWLDTSGDPAAAGDLATLRHADGRSLGLALAAGQLLVREAVQPNPAPTTVVGVALTPGRHHVALVRTVSTATLVVDGVVVGSGTLLPAGPAATASATVTVGAPAGGPAAAARAVVDEVALLPVALTTAQAAALVAANRW